MALFNYFKRTERVKSAGSSTLPDPTGPLSKVVPSSSIEEATKKLLPSRMQREQERNAFPI